MSKQSVNAIIADFETKGIEPRPNYPPKPVSLGLWWPGERKRRLYAWGHADGSKAAGNNCTEREARGAYIEAVKSGIPMAFQNAMFDVDVADVHWDVPIPAWQKFHDTMFLIFLDNPHSPSLGLKESAERLLGMKPEERDKVREWILANVPEAARKPSSAGAYIWRCPFQIVGPYLDGDLTRTRGILDFLLPRIIDAGMGDAYDRERRLMPILLRNARRGMRIDIPALERDTPKMRAGIEAADAWLRKRLGDINLNSPMQLGKALYDKKIVLDFKRTAKGQISTSKKHLTIDKFKDKQVYQALTYRAQADTAVGTFMESWLALAGDDDSLYPDWSQVKAQKGGGNNTKGAKTGRLICQKPNLLNLPKQWKKAVVAGYVHPSFIKGLPELPFIRTYALPHKHKQWGHRDFHMQELFLFAYYEEGPVQEQLIADPDYDIHESVRAEEARQLIAAGLRDSMDRDTAKNTVFARLYGQGVTGLLETLKLSEDERPVAQVVQRAINTALPSIKELDNQLKALVNTGRPIRTIGGRLYYVEEPKYVERFGRVMDFAYRMLNMLCQGSGADFTKEAICLYDEHPKRAEDMLVSVYDEINIDLPMSARGAKQEMAVLNECMVSAFDISPLTMRSDGKVGPSWGELKKWKD